MPHRANQAGAGGRGGRSILAPREVRPADPGRPPPREFRADGVMFTGTNHLRAPPRLGRGGVQWWLKACLPARRERQEEKKERILKVLDEVRASRSSSSPMWGARAPASSVSMREELADGTALVQEYIESEEGAIVHVEVLDGRYLYAIRIVRD